MVLVVPGRGPARLEGADTAAPGFVVVVPVRILLVVILVVPGRTRENEEGELGKSEASGMGVSPPNERSVCGTERSKG